MEHTPTIQTVIELIDSLYSTNCRLLVSIDGRCASGKTTLAAALQERYGCTVIPMDHFFLRPEQRTADRLAVPGEKVDHERFLKEVLLPLKRGEAFSYRPFDCGRMVLGDPIAVNPTGLTVIEGSYSCHRSLRELYDLRIFLTVDPQEQMRRLIIRNGDYAEVFRKKWIPLEEQYFSVSDAETHWDLRLCTG